MEKVLHNKWASNTPTQGDTGPETQPKETVIGSMYDIQHAPLHDNTCSVTTTSLLCVVSTVAVFAREETQPVLLRNAAKNEGSGGYRETVNASSQEVCMIRTFVS
ncbi:unnamed protein product [Pleuronectes platessa]|uniref:Uncharacterized protein n=1 Tax=Pleuronectes platessa TaxID=8262 RepID=A0A9N7V5Y6_PLEPL|nr:unnamed protein product [Pleuronectes platessa]